MSEKTLSLSQIRRMEIQLGIKQKEPKIEVVLQWSSTTGFIPADRAISRSLFKLRKRR